MTCINVDSLTIEYANNCLAIDGVSFRLNKGEVVGLLGPNGAGKTTLIKACIGMIGAYSGEVSIDGEPDRHNRFCDNRIGYIADEPIFFEFMTVMEHVQFVSSIHSNQGFYGAEELIPLFSLEKHKNKYPSQLSKGTRQKLSIAMALLQPCSYFFADEPFSGLDPEHIFLFKRTLMKLRDRSCGVLVSTHLLNLAEGLCDRYILMADGYVVAQGTKGEIISSFNLQENASLEEIYLSIAECMSA